MPSPSYRALPLALAALFACQPDDDADTGDTAGSADELDVRVEVPPADPRFHDIVTAEAVVPPGEEKVFCFHLGTLGADTGVRNLESYQGKYGHHAIVLATKEPMPEGTVEDCTAVEDMLKYESLVIPLALPEGHGAKIPGDVHLVAQSHYVNAGDKPLRIRDVMRIELIDFADITEEAATFALNSIDFVVPPGESSVEFDCTVPYDMDVLLVGGHMHEQGMRHEVFLGATDAVEQRLYLADPWRPEFRDTPPITKMFDAPLSLKAGDVIRTRCTWNNQTGEALEFPTEMCSSFGYARGSFTPWDCRTG